MCLPVSMFVRALLALLAVMSLAPSAAGAATGPWATHDLVRARLISAVDGVGELTSLPLGLEIEIKPGWKTYWRSPGDAGLPPVLTLDEQPGIRATRFDYPAPHRFSLFGLETR